MLICCSEKMALTADSTPGWLRWMCNKRCLPGCSGSATSGKLTALRVDPLLLYLINFSATSMPMFSCASSVLPPMWGVSSTLSKPRNGETNSSPSEFGFDVFPSEPKTEGEEFVSPLRGFDNVLLTPHIGGSTEEAQENIGIEVAEKLIKYSNNGSTLSAVNFPEVSLPEHPCKLRLLHVH